MFKYLTLHSRPFQAWTSGVLFFLIHNAVAWSSLSVHAPVALDNVTNHVNEAAPEDTNGDGTVMYSSTFYTVVIVMCIFAMPITIILLRLYLVRRKHNAMRYGHAEMNASNLNKIPINDGVYIIDTDDSILISPPPYQQCVPRDSDKPPPYDAFQPYAEQYVWKTILSSKLD